MKSTRNAERPRIAAAGCKNTDLHRIEFLFVQLLWPSSYHRRLRYLCLLSYLRFERYKLECENAQISQNTYPSKLSVNRAGIIRERCGRIV